MAGARRTRGSGPIPSSRPLDRRPAALSFTLLHGGGCIPSNGGGQAQPRVGSHRPPAVRKTGDS
eukprot:1403433-Lingulodinium_polyedra.AAC.1